ncbi:MAG: hypothetical protein ACI31C_06550 [Muribaculaceae bacterium]
MKKAFTSLFSLMAIASFVASAESFPGTESLITEQPTGECTWYSRDCVKYMHLLGPLEFGGELSMPSPLVSTEDNSIYFGNLISDIDGCGWIKGALSDDGKSISISFPQTIFYEDWGKEQYFYYAALLNMNDDQTDFVIADNQTLTLIIDEQGNIVESNPDIMIGMCYLYDPSIDDQKSGTEGDGCVLKWFGIGYNAIEWHKLASDIASMPADASVEQFALSYSGNARFVNVGVKDNNVYIQGLLEDSDACAVGTISEDGSEVIFQSAQFMGISDDMLYFTYFVAAAPEDITDPETMTIYHTIAPAEQFRASFDNDTHRIAFIDAETGFAISTGAENVGGGTLFLEPTMFPQADFVFDTPADPVFNAYTPYDETAGFGTINFDLPFWNNDGLLIDRNNIYYNVYFDDQVATFSPDLYWDLTADMTDIPYNYTDYYDFFAVGVNHAIYLYQGGYSNIGVQAIVRSGDTELRGPIVYYGNQGIHNITTDADIISVEYYNLNGSKVNNPTSGIYIKCTHMSDGTVKREKSVMR